MCDKVGLKDYQICDPKNYEVNRAFPYALIVGNVPGTSIDARKLWQVNPPDPSLSADEKKKIFQVFKDIQIYLLANKEPSNIDADNIPRLKDLEEFLKDFKGQMIELRLSDGRMIGIYPDGERLQMKYPVEHHVSTIINLARIKEIFDIKRVMIKDL